MNSASSVESPEWREGKAPKTIGEAVNVEVYRFLPNNLSMRASPAGSPWIE